MLQLYFPILVFIAFGLFVGVAALAIGRLVAPSRPDEAKLSPYECGFPGVSDARLPFDIRYYLVAILFIIFDLETAFLFPWAVSLRHIGTPGLTAMGIFIGLLFIGFVYEWKKGALEWE
ncbi:NADH-quinone oxidoreductase subunit A [Rickettsiella endosymbiont of Dermanyssus gallinae]|uniref:NADH-quinone oxidoreductase subunit A n=1 Tax=Rickettsiella endosymbiont of Dermanyssus gallinae TaxID=2856608 RepID=UPI001C528BE1|nr:NADH-quinone oxidoreductase subunit A [Rickettsiella endosymbiont of Dermanyssus gallinae]